MGHDESHEGALAERFEQHRPRLRALAERLLGSPADAEDAVQDSWLRLRKADTGEIVNLGGWLTTVTSRLCLDRLRARHARPETFLDEPGADRRGPDDPARDALVADSVGRALVVVLDSLSPAERVAFVLHDVFAVPFAEIAPILERSTEATKKLAGRARRRAQLGAQEDQQDLSGRREIIARFLAAVRDGDMAALLAVLAPDATRTVDPVLLAPGRPPTARGARAIIEEARSLSGPARNARPTLIDGRPGAVVLRDGTPALAITFTFVDGLVHSYDVIAAPERLDGLRFEPYD
jgi:RNA polymerase sigma factor (sigma-70 family)